MTNSPFGSSKWYPASTSQSKLFDEADCDDGRRVLFFRTLTERDSYKQLGEAFGGHYKVGDGFLVEK